MYSTLKVLLSIVYVAAISGVDGAEPVLGRAEGDHLKVMPLAKENFDKHYTRLELYRDDTCSVSAEMRSYAELDPVAEAKAAYRRFEIVYLVAAPNGDVRLPGLEIPDAYRERAINSGRFRRERRVTDIHFCGEHAFLQMYFWWWAEAYNSTLYLEVKKHDKLELPGASQEEDCQSAD